MAEQPLWTPDPDVVARSPLSRFMAFAGEGAARTFETYEALQDWSIAEPAAFWRSVWDFCDIIGEPGEVVVEHGAAMPGARFFPHARLNFAENLLRRRDHTDAILFRGEDKVSRRLSWQDLHGLVSRLQQAMRGAGVGEGDRVAAMMPNMPETVAMMLATASIGAVWSSCSPDFGVRGVLDRFGQIAPKLFIACDGYWYNGKRIDIAEKLAGIVEGLPSAARVVIVPYLGEAVEAAAALPRATSLDDFIAAFASGPVRFERLPFAHPLYVLYSSGTTGMPKCIVHGAGGTLLQHLKEHRLHCSLEAGERFFYFTTCGWMMWNWLVSGLASEATLCLYDGSPFAPGPRALFDYCADEGIALFGTSAKFIDAVRKESLCPKETHDLGRLRMMTSTGSPLAPENFSFVYDAIKPDLHLASISGGTDIVSCFVLGIPARPVWKGEIQGAGLGMAVEVWDADGRPMSRGKGELVCTRPFPSMPIGFWNDQDGSRYRAAYFERFPGVWCHGDFAEWTRHGGIVIHGRSDATLNPGGVRIGTAEIYNVVETLPEVLEAIAIGQDWEGDVRVVLFVRLADGLMLDDTLQAQIKSRIRAGASPRHVPAKIIAVADIPRTKSGKITELAVRDVVHGRPVHNAEALANPQALDLFRDLPALRA